MHMYYPVEYKILTIFKNNAADLKDIFQQGRRRLLLSWGEGGSGVGGMETRCTASLGRDMMWVISDGKDHFRLERGQGRRASPL